MTLSDEDRRVLEFVADQPFVLVSHVQALCRVDERAAHEQLEALRRRGLVRAGPRLRRQLGSYLITAAGLLAIGSELPVPRIDLRRYWHHIDGAWLWLRAAAGAFGQLDGIYSEREMRAADQTGPPAGARDLAGLSPALRAKVADASFGARVADGPGPGPGGLHYPDLVLVLPEGRVAVELHRVPAGREQRERALAAYKRNTSLAAILFLVDDERVGGAVTASAARLGMSDIVHVQRFRAEHRVR